MQDVMVTGRISPQKKQAGNAILQAAGLNASQAINLMYSKLIGQRSAAFLNEAEEREPMQWQAAASFVDSLAKPAHAESRFDTMSDAEIRMDRLRSRGLA